MSDMAATMTAAGLTDEQMSSQLFKVLFARVEEAERLLRRASAQLEKVAHDALRFAEQGDVHTTVGGLPLYATADASANFDAALMRLLERRDAVRMALEAS